MSAAFQFAIELKKKISSMYRAWSKETRKQSNFYEFAYTWLKKLKNSGQTLKMLFFSFSDYP